MSSTVVIAGGGPTGLMLAGELGLMGVRAVVVEERAEPATVSQGMGMHGRTLEVFRQRGLLDEAGIAKLPVWPRTPFAMMWLDVASAGPEDQTYAFPQWRTEALLEARACELGAEIRRGARVAGLADHGNGVSVRIATAGGEESLEAAYVVGCDGEFSAVRAAAGIDFPAEGDTYYGMIGDVPLTDPEAAFSNGRFPGGMFAVLPLQPGAVRFMTVEFERERPPAGTPATGDELLDAVERITGERPDVTPGWVSRYGNHTRLATQYRKGRVFVAGDAAHVLFVSGTQGLNAGIQDAVNLGWKLAAAVRGWAPDGLLDTYHAERHPIGARLARHARAQMRLLHPFDRVGDVRELFGEFLRYPAVHRFLLEQSTDDVYPMPGGDDELLGRRLPDAADLLRNGQGLLVDSTAEPLDVAAWSDRLHLVSASATPARRVLVRPDGIVAYVGTDDAETRAAVRTWFGEPAVAGVSA